LTGVVAKLRSTVRILTTYFSEKYGDGFSRYLEAMVVAHICIGRVSTPHYTNEETTPI